MTRSRSGETLALALMLVTVATATAPGAARAEPSPIVSSSPAPTPTLPVAASLTPRAWSPSPSPAAGTSPSPHPRPTAAPSDDDGAVAPDTDASAPSEPLPVASATLEIRPRAFRTPFRDAPPPFVAPQAAPGAAPDSADQLPSAPAHMAQPHASSVTVVFRVGARTAIEGFDLLVTYPLAAGDFAGSGDQVACTTGQGLTANDHDDGTMRLLVASAQTLPLPLSISCRFLVAAGAALDARAIGVQVREVSSGYHVADPSLLTVSVDVR